MNKTYDGNTSASVTFGDDRIAGDVLAYTSTASFADKNAANGKTVSVSGIVLGGQDAGNYALASTTASTSANIAKRTLVASATGLNKTYDGGTAATVLLGDDRVAGDQLSLGFGGASFANKNAGNGKTVTITDVTLGGGDFRNPGLFLGTSALVFAIVGIGALVSTAPGPKLNSEPRVELPAMSAVLAPA